MGENKDRPVPDTREVRASDAERDAVAELLREAVAEGRLDPEEHSERLDAVYAAKTRAALEPLVRDLPSGSAGGVPAVLPDGTLRPVEGAERLVEKEPTSRNAFTIMSGVERGGEWVVPETFTAASVMGHVEIDLREARFTARQATIQAHTLMGAVEVIVPDDVSLRVEGVGIMGGYWMEGEMPGALAPDTPVVTVTGAAVMGAIWGGYKRRKHQIRAKKRWWHRKGQIGQ